MMLKELALELGVSINAVFHFLKVMGYTRKKMARYKEHKNYVKWTKSYLTKLESFKRGGHEIIYMDETGFAPRTSHAHGYSAKSKRIYGRVDSQTRPRTSLIGGYRDGNPIEKLCTKRA